MTDMWWDCFVCCSIFLVWMALCFFLEQKNSSLTFLTNNLTSLLFKTIEMPTLLKMLWNVLSSLSQSLQIRYGCRLFWKFLVFNDFSSFVDQTLFLILNKKNRFISIEVVSFCFDSDYFLTIQRKTIKLPSSWNEDIGSDPIALGFHFS